MTLDPAPTATAQRCGALRMRAGATRLRPGPVVRPRPELLAGLNPVQAEAVAHAGGPLLIVAGAGSGKTRVLTHRIAWLIAEQGVSPFEILAITFTNKAAQEMRERVEALVGPVARRMWVSTFHSACVRILRRDASRLGYRSNFTIYDQADAVRLTGYVIRDLDLDPKQFPPRAIHAIISTAKNELIDFETYSARARTIMERRVAEVYREYQQRLLAANAMDFDDLLLVAVNLLQACPDVLEHYQRAVPACAGRRVPGHQPGPKRAGPPPRRRAPPGVGRRRQRPVGVRVAGRRHPQHPPVRGGLPRRHRGGAGAELPLHPDHPRRRQRRHRQQRHAPAQGPVDRAGSAASRSCSYQAEDEHDEGRWLAEIARLHRAPARTAPTAGATWRSSTAPTPRAAPSRRSSSGGTSPTRWSAAPGSTTGRRSRTCWPTCGRRQPSRRGVAQAHRQRPQARRRRHQRGPAGPLRPGARDLSSPTSWPTPEAAGVTGKAADRSGRPAWSARASCAPSATDGSRPGPAARGGRWSGPGTWRQLRPSTPSRPPAASRTSRSWSGRPAKPRTSTRF